MTKKKTINLVNKKTNSGNVVVAKSWDNVIGLLFDDSWDKNILRHRSRHAFRGTSNANFHLEPSIMRIGDDYRDREHHLLRSFKKYAHRSIFERDSFWYWLSVAQHHGLPTRLLDWTYSPLVALHFATCDIENFSIDGCVWKVDYSKIHSLLPNGLNRELKNEGAQIFTVEMLDRQAPDLNALDKIGGPQSDFVLFFEPPSIDDRIVNQFAYFSVATNPTLVIDDWLVNVTAPKIWTKIIIPADIKWEIRDKLDQANVSERVLLPGLDGLSQWLKRHYTKR